ncbi:MAG: IclR family transcriptional regulator C-terminal domain-containing protein [Ilumatobacteraceae bacterium]
MRNRVDPDGVVSRDGTLEAGITAVSAPIITSAGVVAAINVVGPSFRLRDRELTANRRAVAAAAASLSAALGHIG